jgi:hypothetical protein
MVVSYVDNEPSKDFISRTRKKPRCNLLGYTMGLKERSLGGAGRICLITTATQ